MPSSFETFKIECLIYELSIQRNFTVFVFRSLQLLAFTSLLQLVRKFINLSFHFFTFAFCVFNRYSSENNFINFNFLAREAKRCWKLRLASRFLCSAQEPKIIKPLNLFWQLAVSESYYVAKRNLFISSNDIKYFNVT